jgi:adenosine deaminase
LRVTLLASEQSHGGQLVLSLAGGRKTMSADLQSAGNLFGAAAWLHVVGPEPSPALLFARTDAEKAAQPVLFAAPLPAELAQAITPLVAGSGQRNELLDIELDGRRVSSAAFPLPLAEPGQICAWPLPAQGCTLHLELTRRQHESSQLLGNFLAQVARAEHHENWRSLYRLPPEKISALRATRLTPVHAGWLVALPKADLHRHLGGCLGLEAQQTVAQAILTEVTSTNGRQSLGPVRELLSKSEWPWNWPQQLHGPDRALHTAMVLLQASPAQLQHNLYGVTEPRIALKNHVLGFAAYERPGELSGSALLTHPAAIAPYARAIVRQAQAEGLAYLELRGSPHKYRPTDPIGFLMALRTALQDTGAQTHSTALNTSAGEVTWPRIGFIWILDRRQRGALRGVVAQAVAAHSLLAGFLLGLDLAGDEGTHNPADLAPDFQSAFADCLPITIHAGEGEAAENIWQAAYHLHADRIGHGLTLAQHPQLAAKFRDRGICLELCPSSNREVVGFADPAFAASQGCPVYPLRHFIELGLPITLCTDNPGISRTTLAGEYLAAARMTDGGITLWESLALMRQAFVHAFLPSVERGVLIKRADEQVFSLISTCQDGGRGGMKLQADDTVLREPLGDEVVLPTRLVQMREAQAMVRQHVPVGVSLVDESIVDRRAENARDEAA